MTPPPDALLAQARLLCDDQHCDRAFWATRAATVLARQAMEAWLEAYWEVTDPAVGRLGSLRTRFLLLHAMMPPPAPAHAYATWSRLSEACHHYSHDLPPSPDDVRAWVEDAAAFAAALHEAARRRR